jgi:hypothetical protein
MDVPVIRERLQPGGNLLWLTVVLAGTGAAAQAVLFLYLISESLRSCGW